MDSIYKDLEMKPYYVREGKSHCRGSDKKSFGSIRQRCL